MIPHHEDPALEFSGARVLVLGGSPAVSETPTAQLDAWREAGGLVVGVNHTLRVYPRCDGILWADPPVAVEERVRFEAFWGAIYCFDAKVNESPGHYLHAHPGARSFALGKASTDPASWPKTKADPLPRQGTSPPWAMLIALLHGAAEINVLGVDHNAPSLRMDGHRTHSYSVEPRPGSTPNGGGQFNDQHAAFYRRFLAECQRRNVGCWNLSPYRSPFTLRSGWPVRTMQEALYA